MEFGSLDACLSYIKGAIADSMPEVADEIKIVLDQETSMQVGGYSGQIFSSVIAESGGMEASAGFEDTGNWTSLISGVSVGNPIKFLEGGHTWNRGASSIMMTSTATCETRIPQFFASCLRSRGIPIQ